MTGYGYTRKKRFIWRQ